MAKYTAVIDIIVENRKALTKIQDEIDGIYDSINKIKNTFYISEKPLVALQKQAKELEKIAQAQQRQIKQKEQEIVQQSKLNAAVDLYERRLKQASTSGASSLKKFEGQVKEIEAAFKFFKDKGNITAVQALATELGRMVEYSNTVSRNERARAATLSQIRGFARQLADYELRGLDTAKAREKFDKLAAVAGSNQLNEVKKYTEALIRQLQLLKEKAALQAQIAKETGAMQGALGRLEEEQRQLENSKLDEKALRIQEALDRQAAAAAETAAQTAQLNQRQQEFTARTDEAARAASRQTAEYLRMQRAAKEVARINQIARPAQLLLPPAAPGSPAMSGGARSLITGPVERAGGARTVDEAAMALRYAQGLKEQIRPLSQIQALYGGIFQETSRIQRVKALPDTEMLNAAVRGIKQLETAEDQLNRERQESIQRLQQLDRLEESRARRAQKLQNIASYLRDKVPPGTQPSPPPLPPRARGMFDVSEQGTRPGSRPGSLAFNVRPSAENLALGAGFPLLFGGGAGQVAGGLAGSFFGAGFGGQILGSAIGQQLESALSRITEISKATRTLNIETLRNSAVFVNAELETTVRLLVEAGKNQEAVGAAAEAVAAQLGVLPSTVTDIENNVNVLNGAWNEFLRIGSATLSIIGAPFVTALTGILKIVSGILYVFNKINSIIFGGLVKGVEYILTRLPGGKAVLESIKTVMGAITEEEEARVAALTAVNEKQLRELQNSKQILALEAQRTLGRTDAEKAINAELSKQQSQLQIKAEYDQKELELRQQYADVTSAAGLKELENAVQLNSAKEKQALREQEIKDLLVAQGLEIEANIKKYQLAGEAIQRQIDALERGQQVRQSQFAVEAALNDLYGAQLERQYQIAGTAQERYRIALLQFQQQVTSAQIEYKLAVSNNEILVQKTILQTRLVELKYKELEAEKSIAVAQAAARGNTPQQIAAIAGSYNKALGVQKEVVQSAYDQLNATKQIATNQNIVAKAVYQTRLIQAESALAQKLTSAEIGMSKRMADNLAYSLRVATEQAFQTGNRARALVGVIEVGTQRTYIFANAMSNVAAAANNAAYNIDRAFQAQLRLNAARGANTTSATTTPVKTAATGAFWPGGFTAFASGGMVTRPTLGLVGEGGEAEYIIPASKMATAASNYLAGGRGAGIMEGTSSGTTPVINVQTGPVVEMNGDRYVTLDDFERGLRQVAGSVYKGLRTPAGRYAMGVR